MNLNIPNNIYFDIAYNKYVNDSLKKVSNMKER